MMFTINNLPIRIKLIGNSIILLILLAISSGYAWYSINKIGGELKSIAEQDLPLTQKLTKLTEYQLGQAILLERAIRHGQLIPIDDNAETLFKGEVKAFEATGKKFLDMLLETQEFARKAIEMAHTSEEAQEFAHVLQVLKEIDAGHAKFTQQSNHTYSLIDNGKFEEVDAIAEKLELEVDELNTIMEEILEEVENFTLKASQRAELHEHQAIKLLTIITLLSLFVGAVFSWLLSKNMSVRIQRTAASLDVIANGDLTREVSIDGRDEIGQLQLSMKNTQDRLLEMISSIKATTFQLSSTAEEVSEVMSQTSNNIQDQQRETGLISTSIAEMSSAIREVSNSVVDVSTATNQANTEAENGMNIVEDTVNGIQTLASKIENTSDAIARVQKDSENINTVLDVIKGIAEQTNLLALNAAIEAARAGEQGRGFAVVADEVRTLAGRTQDSTAEINQIIEQLHSGASHSAKAMEESREQTLAVVEKASIADKSLKNIAQSVFKIDEMSTQIATAAEQQSTVSENMKGSIGHINEMATHNATSAQETSKAGLDLARIAADLQSMVEKFQVK